METQGNTSTGSRHHDFDINLVTFDLTFLERGVGVTSQGMKDLVVWGRGGGGGGRAGEEKKMWVGEGSH